MSPLVRLLTSSIGRKLLMGATGLLLIGFLVVHLTGNLLVFVGPAAFNEYSHALISNHLIYLAELALLRRRMYHSAADAHALAHERELLEALTARRAEFVGMPGG